MNYIGSKLKLSNFIETTINSIISEDLSEMVFCDIFAGTGIIGRNFKDSAKKIISNDFEYYSYVLNRNYIGNHTDIPEKNEYIHSLNSLAPVEGIIYNHYCKGGGGDRQYFSDENGGKIDAIRQKIREWKEKDEIGDDLYYFLLASLIESADKVANTASIYGAYLKHLKESAKKELILSPANFTLTDNEHEVYCEDGNELIKKIKGDILYIDPPYNARQYGSNYHMLNTIALYDDFIPRGKTGLRKYKKSAYCSRLSVKNAFEDLIKNADFKYIFLSYNNEGLMSSSDIKKIMSRYGHYGLTITKNKRFKSYKDSNRKHKAKTTNEYLHILTKD